MAIYKYKNSDLDEKFLSRQEEMEKVYSQISKGQTQRAMMEYLDIKPAFMLGLAVQKDETNDEEKPKDSYRTHLAGSQTSLAPSLQKSLMNL